MVLPDGSFANLFFNYFFPCPTRLRPEYFLPQRSKAVTSFSGSIKLSSSDAGVKPHRSLDLLEPDLADKSKGLNLRKLVYSEVMCYTTYFFHS